MRIFNKQLFLFSSFKQFNTIFFKHNFCKSSVWIFDQACPGRECFTSHHSKIVSVQPHWRGSWASLTRSCHSISKLKTLTRTLQILCFLYIRRLTCRCNKGVPHHHSITTVLDFDYDVIFLNNNKKDCSFYSLPFSTSYQKQISEI